MNKNYRPDGWDNPEEGKPDFYFGRSIIRTSKIYEAGADAMLESLASLVGDDGWIQFEGEGGRVVAVYIDD